jgi:hypothetical protein
MVMTLSGHQSMQIKANALDNFVSHGLIHFFPSLDGLDGILWHGKCKGQGQQAPDP